MSIFAHRKENGLSMKRMIGLLGNVSALVLQGCFLFSCTVEKTERTAEKEALGKLLFFDESLSEPAGQSCATCHTKETGFADKYSRAVSEGAVAGLFSNRNSMTVAYAAFVPPLSYDEKEETYVGGLFWDGRMNSLDEQAGEPFLNPVEMGNPDKEAVVAKVRSAPYYPLVVRLYGDPEHTDSLYACITDAIAAYERSSEINPFTSKFDAYLAGETQLDEEETLGLALFREKALCAECHILDDDPVAGRTLLTDHTYDNLGIPVHSENPFFSVPETFNPWGRDTVDLGLGGVVKDSLENGKFRVPTLRNVGLTAPYGHNGYFKTLEEIVHFYNMRDVSDEFPPAEYPSTVNREELGDLKLTPAEEAALVAFLKTLTDGFGLDEAR